MLEVTEQQLGNHALCPLRDEIQLPPTVTIANEIAQWALQRAFNNEIVRADKMRVKFEERWHALMGKSEDRAYWNAMRQANYVVTKIKLLVWDNEILQPVTGYNLDLKGKRITGNFALIQKSKQSVLPPMVLCLRTIRPQHYTYPDAFGLARYIAAKHEHPEFKSIGIYHLPLFGGLFWQHKNIDERLATRQIESILESIEAKNSYPAPGLHCKTCASKSCLKVFHVG